MGDEIMHKLYLNNNHQLISTIFEDELINNYKLYLEFTTWLDRNQQELPA